MMRRRIQAVLGTWRGRLAAVLVVLLVVVGSGYTAGYLVVTHGATSMDIAVWRVNENGPPGSDVRIFSKTITNLGLVRAVQSQIDGAQSSYSAGCIHILPSYYVYRFRFATDSHTTQVYEGNSYCGGWSTTTVFFTNPLIPPGNVFINEATLDGVEILVALHDKTGMPLPPGASGWIPDV